MDSEVYDPHGILSASRRRSSTGSRIRRGPLSKKSSPSPSASSPRSTSLVFLEDVVEDAIDSSPSMTSSGELNPEAGTSDPFAGPSANPNTAFGSDATVTPFLQDRGRTPLQMLRVGASVSASPDQPHIGPFTLGKVISHGSYAVVRVASKAHDPHVYAAKIMLRSPGSNLPVRYSNWKRVLSGEPKQSASVHQSPEYSFPARRFSVPSEPPLPAQDIHGILREKVIWGFIPPNPHVVPLLEAQSFEQFTYLVSPYYEGGTLLAYLIHRAAKRADKIHDVTLQLEEIFLILLQVASGLLWIHSHGITHGDIKLENIYSDADNRSWAIGDFGLAHFNLSKPLPDLPPDVFPQDLALPANATSSLPYSPPEMVYSVEPSPVWPPSVDMWALGCALYGMLQDELPFSDSFEPRLRASIIDAQWVLPPRLNDVSSSLSNKIQAVLRGLLEKDVSRRWTSLELVQYLER